MKSEHSIFQQNYDDYLELIRGKSLTSLTRKLGATFKNNKIKIQLFNREYTVSSEGISDASGQKPSYDLCVILSRYILSCPENPPNGHQLISYRNLKNSAPLTDYFKKEVEEAISSYFSGQLIDLHKASESLGGYSPNLTANYDFAIQFDALPMIPLVLLFNNVDEEFPANCSILFESQAEKYLDCECLAMLGRQLFSHLTGQQPMEN